MNLDEFKKVVENSTIKTQKAIGASTYLVIPKKQIKLELHKSYKIADGRIAKCVRAKHDLSKSEYELEWPTKFNNQILIYDWFYEDGIHCQGIIEWNVVEEVSDPNFVTSARVATDDTYEIEKPKYDPYAEAWDKYILD